MAGRFSRRHPALVALGDEHVAVLDAIALVHYSIPRTRMVAALIDRALPELLEEIEGAYPGKLKEIEGMAKALHTHIEQASPRAGIIDLVERRRARKAAKRKERI